ncbi:MAG: hypothetical protein IPK19_06410 [Chloroflexi bacterium]|nr:hypothetical protein [Chloroflexota bacterium]
MNSPALTHQRHSNLPAPVTQLIGRQTELESLHQLLSQADLRMITVLAPGGMGKTMLALEAARQQMSRFADGVYLITLPEPVSAEQLAGLIAEAMLCQVESKRSVQEQILDFLAPRTLLLVLDNAEFALDALPFLNAMLRHTPGIKFLATSQVKLNLYAERVFPLEGLTFANGDGAGSEAGGAMDEAVELFVRRAQNARPSLDLSPQALASIRQICQITGGMPLALVLAASWTALLSPEEIVRELERGFDFLETDLRDLPERQRSIRAIFEYMWGLMSDNERRVLARLSVFRGEFTREAAQQVTGGDLRSLMSLLKWAALQPSSREGRFDMHQILRRYAAERLQQSGEAESIQAAHGRYFLEHAARHTDDIKGGRQIEALNTLDANADNLWPAWQWAVQNREMDLLANALEGLFWFSMMRSRYPLFEAMHRSISDSQWPIEDAEARLLAARLDLRRFWMQRWREGSLVRYPTAIEELESLLTLFEEKRASLEVALCTLVLGDAVRTLADDLDRAQRLMQSSLESFAALGDDYYAAWALHFAARLASDTQGISAGVELRNRGLALRRKRGDQIGVAYSLYNLSTDLLLLGRLEECAQVTQEILHIGQEIGEQSTLLMAQITRTILALLAARSDGARAANAANMRLASSLNHSLGLAWTYLTQGLIAYFGGDDEGAVEALAISEAGASQATLRYFVHLGYVLVQGRDAEGTDRHLFSALCHAETFDALGAQVWCLPPLAAWYARNGQPAQAAALLGLAEAQPRDLMGWLPDWLHRSSLQVNLERALGEDEFIGALERGRQLDLRTVLRTFRARSDTHRHKGAPLPAHIYEANEQLIDPLSDREIEVLRFIGRGFSNREIANELVVELSTVKKHLTHIYDKLDVASRAQAILKAQAAGLI